MADYHIEELFTQLEEQIPECFGNLNEREQQVAQAYLDIQAMRLDRICLDIATPGTDDYIEAYCGNFSIGNLKDFNENKITLDEMNEFKCIIKENNWELMINAIKEHIFEENPDQEASLDNFCMH